MENQTTTRKPVAKIPSGKVCPKCSQRFLRCVDSRASGNEQVFWRRTYHCSNCGHRFSTHEMLAAQVGTDTITPQIRVRIFAEAVQRLLVDLMGDERSTKASISQTGKNLGRRNRKLALTEKQDGDQ